MYHQQKPNFRVVRLVMIETGTYADIPFRPYESVGQSGMLNVMKQFREATRDGHKLEASHLAGVATAFIRPTAEAGQIVRIEHGWDTRKLSFMMEIEHRPIAGNSVVQYISGYTDHVGVADMVGSFAFDPNMKFFINNVISTNRSVTQTGYGTELRQTVTGNNRVLNGEYNPSSTMTLDNTQHTMRPEDVFAHREIQEANVRSAFDTRTTFCDGVRLSTRANDAAPSYLSSLMANYKRSVMSPDEVGQSMPRIYSEAQGYASEALLSQDLFLSALTDTTMFQQGGFVTLSELKEATPHIEELIKCTLKPKYQQIKPEGFFGGYHERGSTEHWNGTSNETVAATILGQAVPALMSHLMLSKILVKASNRVNADGSWSVAIQNPQSFATGLDLSPYLDSFIHRIEHMVLKDLTLNNRMTIDFEGMFDLLYDSRLRISIEGGPWIDYVNPSFSDSLYAPVVAGDYSALKNLSNDLGQLNDNLLTDYSQPNQTYAASHNNSWNQEPRTALHFDYLGAPNANGSSSDVV